MKPKSPYGSGSRPDGEQFSNGDASASELGGETPAVVMMSDDGSGDTGPGERGMPGLGNPPTGAGMRGGGMETGRGSREFDMPNRAMGDSAGNGAGGR